MGVKQTHTYAELGLSRAAYDEIAAALRAAGYDHAFMEDGTIDMHGIGVTCAGIAEPKPKLAPDVVGTNDHD